MRYQWKMIAVWIAHLITWPLSSSAPLAHRLFASESIFDFCAKLFSLLPGRIGRYLRASYDLQTLPRFGYDFSIGFGSFISHMSAEIGHGVGIGSFSIIGTCSLGDNVAPPRGVAEIAKVWIKGKLPGGDRKMEQLLEYNEWVRNYAERARLPLLDLERAVRVSDTDRVLRTEFAENDRVHLNADACRALDELMVEFIASLPGSSAGQGVVRKANSLP